LKVEPTDKPDDRILRIRNIKLANVQWQIAALSRPFFNEVLTLPVVPDSNVPFRATITNAPFFIGEIEHQQAPSNGSTHKTAVSTRTAFKNAEKSGMTPA
jgi:hypothetical protein